MTPDRPPATDLMFRYFTEVMILSHLAATAFETAMTDGMTMAQFSILNHLCRVGNGQTQVEIARAMQVRKSTMTSTLAALLAAGHVTVSPDEEDRRSKRVHVTEKGRTARSDAIMAIERKILAFGPRLVIEDFAAGLPSLERIRKVFDNMRD